MTILPSLINKKICNGNNKLLHACLLNKFKIVKFLLNNGAIENINQINNSNIVILQYFWYKKLCETISHSHITF